LEFRRREERIRRASDEHYTVAGTYTVTLTVTDSSSNSATTSKQITIH
jgi:PKD repeat protein